MTPTRRGLLRTVPVVAVGSLAGCLAAPRNTSRPTTEQPTQAPGGDRTPDDHETRAPTPIPQPDPQVTTAPLTLTLFNEDDTDHTLTVAVEQAGETVYERDYSLSGGGIVESPVAELDPGTYDVFVVDSQQVSYRFDWEVPADGRTDGHLSVVVREDGTLEPTFASRHVSGSEPSTCNGEPC